MIAVSAARMGDLAISSLATQEHRADLQPKQPALHGTATASKWPGFPGCLMLPPQRGSMNNNTSTHLTDEQRIDWLRLIRSDNVGPRGIMAQTPQAIPAVYS
jgi:hypothetical protein